MTPVEKNIVFTKTENAITTLFLKYMTQRRGRAWLLKRIIRIFPKLNNTTLVIYNNEIALDLRNEADVGYFYGQGISHERFYQELLLKLGDDKTVFYDIGANIGYYSLLLSPFSKKIYAFEPNPILSDRLSKTIKRNSLQNIKLFNIGVSNQNSDLPFYFDGSNHNLGTFIHKQDGSKEIMIEVKRLDDILVSEGLETPEIIKIDTEGLELDILEGYSKINEHLPILVIEWMPESNEVEKMSARLFKILNHQYEVYRIGIDPELTPYSRQSNSSSNLLLFPIGNPKKSIIEKWIKT